MTQTDSSVPPTPPRLAFVCEARVQVGTPIDVGGVAGGRRRIIPIVGGTFAGPDLSGRVLNQGADWQLVRDDGVTALDTRYLLETGAGEVIYVQNAGIRHAPPDVMRRLHAGEVVDPSLVYFTTVPTFETAAPRLQWLTQSIFIGTGERYPDLVVVRFWQVR